MHPSMLMTKEILLKESTLNVVRNITNIYVTSLIAKYIVELMTSFGQKYFKISRKKINHLKYLANMGDDEGPFLVYYNGKVVGIVGGPPGEGGSGGGSPQIPSHVMDEWIRQIQGQAKKEGGKGTPPTKGKQAKANISRSKR